MFSTTKKQEIKTNSNVDPRTSRLTSNPNSRGSIINEIIPITEVPILTSVDNPVEKVIPSNTKNTKPRKERVNLIEKKAIMSKHTILKVGPDGVATAIPLERLKNKNMEKADIFPQLQSGASSKNLKIPLEDTDLKISDLEVAKQTPEPEYTNKLEDTKLSKRLSEVNTSQQNKKNEATIPLSQVEEEVERRVAEKLKELLINKNPDKNNYVNIIDNLNEKVFDDALIYNGLATDFLDSFEVKDVVSQTMNDNNKVIEENNNVASDTTAPVFTDRLQSNLEDRLRFDAFSFSLEDGDELNLDDTLTYIPFFNEKLYITEECKTQVTSKYVKMHVELAGILEHKPIIYLFGDKSVSYKITEKDLIINWKDELTTGTASGKIKQKNSIYYIEITNYYIGKEEISFNNIELPAIFETEFNIDT